MLLARADEVIENLLQCKCLLLAQSGLSAMSPYLSAFGAERTWRDGGGLSIGRD
jgi:hypothetical protein